MSGEDPKPPSQELPDQGQFSDAESCTSYDTPPPTRFRPFCPEGLPTVVVKPRTRQEEDNPLEPESRNSSSSELWGVEGPTYNPTLPGQFSDAVSEEAPTEWIVDISSGEEAKTSSVTTKPSTRQRITTWTDKCPKLTAGKAAMVSALTTAAITSAMFVFILSGVNQSVSGCPKDDKIDFLPGKAKVKCLLKWRNLQRSNNFLPSGLRHPSCPRSPGQRTRPVRP